MGGEDDRSATSSGPVDGNNFKVRESLGLSLRRNYDHLPRGRAMIFAICTAL